MLILTAAPSTTPLLLILTNARLRAGHPGIRAAGIDLQLQLLAGGTDGDVGEVQAGLLRVAQGGGDSVGRGAGIHASLEHGGAASELGSLDIGVADNGPLDGVG